MNASIPFADWREQLSRVEGTLIGRERRVSTAELVALVGAAELKGADRINALNRIKQDMLALGWRGPAVMRVGRALTRGYRKLEPKLDQPADQQSAVDPVPVEMEAHPLPVAKISREEELAQQLERVCHLSMDKIEEILRLPTDADNGNILRAQTAVAGHAIQAQLRADETRLQTRKNNDVLDRLLKIIRREKKIIRQGQRKIPRAPEQIIPDNTPVAEA
jgi:hypothetical protein